MIDKPARQRRLQTSPQIRRNRHRPTGRFREDPTGACSFYHIPRALNQIPRPGSLAARSGTTVRSGPITKRIICSLEGASRSPRNDATGRSPARRRHPARAHRCPGLSRGRLLPPGHWPALARPLAREPMARAAMMTSLATASSIFASPTISTNSSKRGRPGRQRLHFLLAQRHQHGRRQRLDRRHFFADASQCAARSVVVALDQELLGAADQFSGHVLVETLDLGQFSGGTKASPRSC